MKRLRISASSMLSSTVLEVQRCRAHVAAGGSVSFWTNRLQRAAIEHEQAAEHLRRQIAALKTARGC